MRWLFQSKDNCLKVIGSKIRDTMKQKNNINWFTMSSLWLYHFLAFLFSYLRGSFVAYYLAKLSQTAQIMSNRELPQENFFFRRAILSILLSWLLIFQNENKIKKSVISAIITHEHYTQLGWISQGAPGTEVSTSV